MSGNTLIQIAILFPLLASALIAFSGKNPDLRDKITLASSAILFLIVIFIYRDFQALADGEQIAVQWAELVPGLALGFRLESLGMLFALIASALWLVTSIYGIGYMRGNQEKNQTRFFMLFPVAISAALGIAFASNLLTLFIFYEVMTLSTFPLVTHKGTEHAMKSGRIYLGVLIGSSIGLLLPAIIWVWSVAGTTDFSVGGILQDKLSPVQLSVLAALFVLGVGKAAVMPIHRWLPAAMVAPTPVSALLHAVAVVKAGVFSVLKIVVYVIGIETLSEASYLHWLVYLVGFTIVMASIIALGHDNLKKRLAYSTISQLSYVVLGALILSPISVVGSALHIAAHAFGKITLFFAAGSIYTASKKTEVSQLDGIGHRMPWTMAAFTVGALSMIGLPPAVGFISKWYLLMGAYDEQVYFAMGVIIVSTLLNTAYFVPIIYRAFFKREAEGGKQHGEANKAIVIALTITALMTIVLFCFPSIPFALAQGIAVS